MSIDEKTIPTPALVVDDAAVERNLKRVAEQCKAHNVKPVLRMFSFDIECFSCSVRPVKDARPDAPHTVCHHGFALTGATREYAATSLFFYNFFCKKNGVIGIIILWIQFMSSYIDHIMAECAHVFDERVLERESRVISCKVDFSHSPL